MLRDLTATIPDDMLLNVRWCYDVGWSVVAMEGRCVLLVVCMTTLNIIVPGSHYDPHYDPVTGP